MSWFFWFKPKNMTLRERVLEIAITQIGQEEKPRGSNWGTPVKDYLFSVGIDFPASWCMAFLYWCIVKASKELGVPIPIYKSGGVLKTWQLSAPSIKVKTAEVGDIFIFDYGKGLGHTGIIEKIEGEFMHTIDGNTNDTGSREGFEVCRKKRLLSKAIGFIRL